MLYHRFDMVGQTMVLGYDDQQVPYVLYWGDTLPKNENLSQLNNATVATIPSHCIDNFVRTSILPLDEEGFLGQRGLHARRPSGETIRPKLTLSNVINQGDETHFIYDDEALSITYGAVFTVCNDTSIITLSAYIKSADDIIVDWLSAPVMPCSRKSENIIDFSGRWCAEMQPNIVPWLDGIRTRESRIGSSSHEHFPAVLLPNEGCTENTGQAYGFSYGWSGGHTMMAEQLLNGNRHIMFGHARHSYPKAEKYFTTAPLYITYSNAGLNGVAQSFKKYIRHYITDGRLLKKSRPVHYNCWEAVYFDHKESELKEIATLAHDLGAERFILDDGWFGCRNDDKSSLGDWHVNTIKYPNGLGGLVDHVKKLGMEFGIWFEPEMINPDSDVYRQNPHWVLGDKNQPLMRNQLVINIALSEVQEYLYHKISTIIDQYDVDYVKWDHNRTLPFADAEQTNGVYALLERLLKRFPALEIESCSGGGGRLDYGMLKRTQRVWLSDCNDPYERMVMQYNASLFLPNDMVGSHVGPRHCHTTGRILPMELRGWTAAMRHMGFEMDPRELTVHETDTLKRIVDWWKYNRDWIFDGISYRLSSQQGALFPEMTIAQGGDKFVIFVGQYTALPHTSPSPVRLAGLNPHEHYCITIENPNDIHCGFMRNKQINQPTSLTATGQFFMEHGVQIPLLVPGTMLVLMGKIEKLR